MVTKTSPASSVTTWYSRDAQGNVMSVYEAGKSSLNDGRLTQTELHLYGSSRLGLLRRSLDVDSVPIPDPFKITMPIFGTGDSIPFGRGNKLFELSNHLGNVLATVNDKKLGVSSNNSIVDYFNPQVMSAQDYYPFGMLQVGRVFNTSGYRYGFNNQESDDEISGDKKSYVFEYRDYDPRLARFKLVDPLAAEYAWNSPYAFAENSPIRYVDLEGLEKADPKAFQTATTEISSKAKGGQSTVFPNLTRAEFVNQLNKMVAAAQNGKSPNFKDDDWTGAWYCGPTGVAFTFLNYNPVGFVTAAFELYDKGTTNIPGGGKITAVNNGSYDASSVNPNAVFEMFATSLRASQNTNGQINDWKDQRTMPWNLTGMVSTLGLKVETGGFLKRENLSLMNSAVAQGKFTILLDNYLVSHYQDRLKASHAQKGDPKTDRLAYNLFGIHYTTVTSSMSVHGKDMSFRWWDVHTQDSTRKYDSSVSNFRHGVKGWWIITK